VPDVLLIVPTEVTMLLATIVKERVVCVAL
jgi:hypothetical protein